MVCLDEVGGRMTCPLVSGDLSRPRKAKPLHDILYLVGRVDPFLHEIQAGQAHSGAANLSKP